MILLLAGFALTSMTASEASEKDKKFAREAAMANLREIKMGNLAQSNSSNASIQALGKKMVADYTRAHNNLKALASKKGIKLPKSMSSKDEKKYNELAKLKGEAFDKEFADCALKNHRNVYEMYKHEAMHADDDDFMTYAYTVGFSAEKHVAKSEAVKKEVK